MDYTNLLKDKSGKVSKVGIVGATKGYGYTLLAQIPKVAHMELRVICSRHLEECEEVLKETGFGDKQIIACANIDEINAAPEDAVLIVSDYRLVMECGITALVECTGNTKVSSDAAISALERGINVYMVSKETDSVCGPLLNQIAAEHGAVYSLVATSRETFWICGPGQSFWDWKSWQPENPVSMTLYGIVRLVSLPIWTAMHPLSSCRR